MTTIVRIFAHSGLVKSPIAPGVGATTETSANLKLPPEGREKLTVDQYTAVHSKETTAPGPTRLLFIQVQDGRRVHFEVTPENREIVPADDSSMVVSGERIIQFGPGWRISFLENVEI